VKIQDKEEALRLVFRLYDVNKRLVFPPKAMLTQQGVTSCFYWEKRLTWAIM
jgi:hypothetical protein